MNKYSIKHVLLLFSLLNSIFSVCQNRYSVLFGTEEFTGLQCKDLSWDRPDALKVSPKGEIYVSGTNSHSTGNPKPNSMGIWVMKFTNEGKLVWFKCSSDDNHISCNPKITAPTSDNGLVVTGSEPYGIGQLNVFYYNSVGTLKKGTLLPNSIKIKFNNQMYECEKVYFAVHIFQETGRNNIGIVVNVQIRVETKQGNVTRLEPVQKVGLVYVNQNLEFVSAVVLDFPPLLYKLDENSYYVYFRAKSHTNGNFALVLKDKPNRQNIIISNFDKNGTKLWSVQKKYDESIYNDAIAYSSTGEVVYVVCKDTNDEYSIFNNMGSETKFTAKNEGAISKISFIENDVIVLYQLGGVGEGTVVLKRLNTKGEVVWRKTFGQKSSYGIDLSVLQDKTIAVLAYTKEFGACYLDGVLIRTDKDGNIEAIPKKYIKAN